MIELGILFGVLVAAALVLLFVLLRRNNSRTENVDGILIEQARRIQVQSDHATWRAGTVDGHLPTRRDHYRP
ncbi:hypothetical protein DIZ27_07035 [Streptomyces sp. NWU339]|nr:hypothetical protein DIZ27_07035 [Streptomyces sp. NWU339]